MVPKSKEEKLKVAMAGGHSNKKKWAKGKVKEKLAYLVMLDKPTYDKLLKEIPNSSIHPMPYWCLWCVVECENTDNKRR